MALNEGRSHDAAKRQEFLPGEEIVGVDVADLPMEVYVQHALMGEAFAARMMADNPENSPETKRAYEWAEQQFLRIYRKEVGERDLIG